MKNKRKGLQLLLEASMFIMLLGCSSSNSTPFNPSPDPSNPSYGKIFIKMATSVIDNQSPYVTKMPGYTLKGLYQSDCCEELERDNRMVLSLEAYYNDPRVVKKSSHLKWEVGQIIPYILPFVYPTIDTLEGYKHQDLKYSVKSPQGQKSFVIPRYPTGYELKMIELTEVQKYIIAEPIGGNKDTYLPIEILYPRLVVDHQGKCQNPILELKPIALRSHFYWYFSDDYDGKGEFTKKNIADIKAFIMNSPDMVVAIDMSDLAVCLRPLPLMNK